MEIVIKNLRNCKPKKDCCWQIKVDRTSVLGNPFYMADESQRDLVCDKYEEYFKEQVKTNTRFRIELESILRICKVFKTVELYCWCAPKRCHAETIKKYLEERLGI